MANGGDSWRKDCADCLHVLVGWPAMALVIIWGARREIARPLLGYVGGMGVLIGALMVFGAFRAYANGSYTELPIPVGPGLGVFFSGAALLIVTIWPRIRGTEEWE